MPRLPRVHLAGVLYYATQHGTMDRPLFNDAEDCQTFLDLLTQYKTKHEFRLFGYSLHSDKLHLIIEPYGATTISEIMRDLSSRYSKYCHARYSGNGSLFKGRFHTVIVEKETLLAQIIRFVNSLPDAMPFTIASSKSFYTAEASELKKSIQPEIAQVLAHLEQKNSPLTLANLAEPMMGEEMDVILKMLKDPVIGSQVFVKKIRAELTDAAQHLRKEVPRTELQSKEIPARPSSWIQKSKVPVLLCALAVLPAFFALNLQNNKVSAPAVVSVPAQAPAAVNENKILHASVVVLDGTEWNVKLISADKNVEFDKISFLHDQVISKNMAAKGYEPTYYTVTTNPDGTIVWETMQTSSSGDIAAWRGEWIDGQMRGVINQQLSNGETRVFNFVGSR